MFESIKRFFKKDEDLDDVLTDCDHDWVGVGVSDYWQDDRFCPPIYTDSLYDEKEWSWEAAKKLVCLKCRECKDESVQWRIEHAKQRMKRELQEKEWDRRGKLAQSIWDERMR